MGEINEQTVAHLPSNHRGPQGTSLKKTMLNIIYFNKINKTYNSYCEFTIFKAIATNGSVL